MATNEEEQPPALAKEESNADSTTSDEEASANAEGVHNIKKLMTETKVEGGKSAWAMTLETFGMSDGSKKKGDVLCDTFEEAFEKLKEMAEAKEEWTFSTTPFEDFNATKEDLLKAFAHWSRKGDDGDKRYNPSKAFRRLESYVEWMNKNCNNMDLKGSTMNQLDGHWKMKVTHDKEGRLVWWIDISSLDLKFLKNQVAPEDTLRYFVWLSHLVLFDKGKVRLMPTVLCNADAIVVFKPWCRSDFGYLLLLQKVHKNTVLSS